jgi:hypothetical protein
MVMSRLLHSSVALRPGKEPLLFMGKEAEWAPEPGWTWKEENTLAPGRIQTLGIQPVASRCID